MRLSSSNQHATNKAEHTLAFYLQSYVHEQSVHNLANETWYLFGDTMSPEWLQLQKLYELPLDAGSDDPAVAVGIGGKCTAQLCMYC